MIKNFVFQGTEQSTGTKIRSVVTFDDTVHGVAWDSDEAMTLMRLRAEIAMEAGLRASKSIVDPDVEDLVLLRIDSIFEDELPDPDTGVIENDGKPMSQSEWDKLAEERRHA